MIGVEQTAGTINTDASIIIRELYKYTEYPLAGKVSNVKFRDYIVEVHKLEEATKLVIKREKMFVVFFYNWPTDKQVFCSQNTK